MEKMTDDEKQEFESIRQASRHYATDQGVLQREVVNTIRPMIREAITEDTIQAIHQMVGLTSRAVSAIEEDLGSEDALIRQRAYTLLIKYTVGNRAVVPETPVDHNAPINITFGLPRPADADNMIDADAQVLETKECDACHQDKPLSDFVANSDRCGVCFEEWRARLTEEYGPGA
jgi:hypothetical protein